jgi:hypothetical protein
MTHEHPLSKPGDRKWQAKELARFPRPRKRLKIAADGLVKGFQTVVDAQVQKFYYQPCSTA